MRALPSNSRGLSAKGLPVNWKTGESEDSPIHRISRSKRWGAPQRSPNYAAILVLTIEWWIIPFTLKNIHSLPRNHFKEV